MGSAAIAIAVVQPEQEQEGMVMGKIEVE